MFIFSKYSQKLLSKLNEDKQHQIISKLKEIRETWNFGNIKTIKSLKNATHRLRIWEYRLLLLKEKESFFIVKLWHRKDIYK